MLTHILTVRQFGCPFTPERSSALKEVEERGGVTDLNPQSLQSRLFSSQTGSVTHLPKCGRKTGFPDPEGCQSFDGSFEYLHNLAVLDALDLIVRPESAGQSDSTNSNLSLVMYAIEFSFFFIYLKLKFC